MKLTDRFWHYFFLNPLRQLGDIGCDPPRLVFASAIPLVEERSVKLFGERVSRRQVVHIR